MRKFGLLLLLASFLGSQSARAQKLSPYELQQIHKIRDSLPALTGFESSGLSAGYRSSLEDLRREIDSLCDGTRNTPSWWRLRADHIRYLKARALLYTEMFRDHQKLQSTGGAHRYRLHSNVNDREWAGPAIELKFELVHQISVRLPVLRSDLESLDRMFQQATSRYREIFDFFFVEERLSTQGVRQMSRGSRRANAFAEQLPRSLEKEFSDLLQSSSAMIEEVASMANEDFPERFKKESLLLESKTKLLSTRILFVARKYRQALPQMVATSKQSFRRYSDLAAFVTELGQELHTAIEHMNVAFKTILEKGDRAFWSTPLDFPGVRIFHHHFYKEIGLLMGYSSSGGMEFNEFTLSEELRGPNGEGILRMYEEALVLQYLTAAGIAIGTLAKTSEGRGPVRERIALGTGLLTGNAHSPRGGNLLPTERLKPTSLFGSLGRRRVNLEDELWQKFFRAAQAPAASDSCGKPLDPNFALISAGDAEEYQLF